MIVTKQELNKARTDKGGFTNKQVRIGQKLTGHKQWLSAMEGMNIPDSEWLEFVQARIRAKTKNAKKLINSVSKKHDSWAWKPTDKDVPRPKFKGKLEKNRGRNKKKRSKIVYSDDFYLSYEWRKLRARVLEKYDCSCMMCGRSPKSHAVIVHVDHIKPRSKHPELALDIDNLQILCEDCNIGKGNRYETDYRPDRLSEKDRELLHSALKNQ